MNNTKRIRTGGRTPRICLAQPPVAYSVTYALPGLLHTCGEPFNRAAECDYTVHPDRATLESDAFLAAYPGITREQLGQVVARGLGVHREQLKVWRSGQPVAAPALLLGGGHDNTAPGRLAVPVRLALPYSGDGIPLRYQHYAYGAVVLSSDSAAWAAHRVANNSVCCEQHAVPRAAHV